MNFPWSFGRAVIYLKRMAAAAERSAAAQEQLSSLAYQEFNLAHPSRRTIKPAEFGIADVETDWNEPYRKQHEES